MDEKQTHTIEIISFAYKKGKPQYHYTEERCAKIIDVRHVRNPWHVKGMRKRTGLDPEVQAYVSQCQRTRVLLASEAQIAHNLQNHWHQSIYVGCVGGKHRSVAVAELLADRLRKDGYEITVTHRDLPNVIDHATTTE